MKMGKTVYTGAFYFWLGDAEWNEPFRGACEDGCCEFQHNEEEFIEFWKENKFTL